jgi:hypothetical protein
VLVSVYRVLRAGFSIGRPCAWSTEFKELEIFVLRHQLVILRLTAQNCCRIPPDGVDVSSPADSIDARPTNAGHARPETPRSDRSSRVRPSPSARDTRTISRRCTLVKQRLVGARILFHISADPLITQHARSNSAILPAASADARGRRRRRWASP